MQSIRRLLWLHVLAVQLLEDNRDSPFTVMYLQFIGKLQVCRGEFEAILDEMRLRISWRTRKKNHCNFLKLTENVGIMFNEKLPIEKNSAFGL